MHALATRLLALYARLEKLDWLPRLLARVGMGLMFAGGGVKKAGHLHDFVDYFRSLHIPAPELQAPFVVCVEIVGGLALVLGAGTRVAAAMLSGTMVVALATAAVPDHHVHADWQGLLDFLYLPEWLLLVTLLWLIFAGPGRASVDHVVKQRLAPRSEAKPVGTAAAA